MGRHLSANDYYSQGEQVKGTWWGKASDMLGLENREVESSDFLSLQQNKHPETGERLRERSAKVNWHDFVVSAPKSFSVAAMVGGDERLLEAFDRSVKRCFENLEGEAAVRLRGGQRYHTEAVRTTGNAVAAVFRHDTSRLLDPQVHSHLVFGNMTWDRESGRWLALQPKTMAEESKAWIRGAFYRDLAKECESLGYAVEKDGQAFRLTEMEPQVEKLFQQRTVQRERFESRYTQVFGEAPSAKRVEEFIKDRKTAARRRFKDEYHTRFGRWPTSEQVDDFAVESRTSKMATSSREKVREGQLGQLTLEQRRSLEKMVLAAREQSSSIGVTEEPVLEEKQEERQGQSQQKRSKLKVPLSAQSNQRKKGISTKQRKSQQSFGRMEALRRMKRGMVITRALQGHPASLLVRQLTQLAQQKQRTEYERTRKL